MNKQNIKTANQIMCFEIACDKADRAIYDTIVWCRKQVNAGIQMSEIDFNIKAYENYAKYGSEAPSFPVMNGFGVNSKHIHYFDHKSDKYLKHNELILFDSGGTYYKCLTTGLTDCTRTFMVYKQTTDKIEKRKINKMKKIYTVALIGFIRAIKGSFDEGTVGRVIDHKARECCVQMSGYDYAHATGHGVGETEVHEAGFELSETSNVILEKGNLGTIEPGIYTEEFGVRHENMVVVEKCPGIGVTDLIFRTLNFVGFDHDLIDMSRLLAGEIDWLFWYEHECMKRDRSFITERHFKKFPARWRKLWIG